MSDTLMISVSGMRGHVGTDLTPELVARHAAALGAWVRGSAPKRTRPAVVLGRDARTSGPMFTHAAAAGFMSVGVDVIDVGVVPTPTVQLAVEHHRAGAGLILTASHNPIEWNALKFVGPDGIFLDAAAGPWELAPGGQGPARAVGATVLRAPVGEANVARAIRDHGAVIGGEGNGGVMYPALHIGRDAPLGVALILHLLARSGVTVAGLVEASPRYTIVKAKGPRTSQLGPLYERLQRRFADAAADDRDGLRLSWADRWLHIRPSGTEPIVRLIAEAPTASEAEALVTA